MNTLPAVTTYPEARALAGQLLPLTGEYHPALGPMWAERAQVMVSPILAALARPVTLPELAEIVADDTARPALLALTMEGRTVVEITADSPSEQWEIVREMLLAAPCIACL